MTLEELVKKYNNDEINFSDFLDAFKVGLANKKNNEGSLRIVYRTLASIVEVKPELAKDVLEAFKVGLANEENNERDFIIGYRTLASIVEVKPELAKDVLEVFKVGLANEENNTETLNGGYNALSKVEKAQPELAKEVLNVIKTSKLKEKREYYSDRSLKAIYYVNEQGKMHGKYTEYAQNSDKVISQFKYKNGKVWEGKGKIKDGYIIYRNGEKIEEAKKYYYDKDRLVPSLGSERDLPVVNCVETEKIEKGKNIKIKKFRYKSYYNGDHAIYSGRRSRVAANNLSHQISYESGVRVDKVKKETVVYGEYGRENIYDSSEWECTFINGEIKEYSDSKGYHATFENGEFKGDYKMPLAKKCLEIYKHPVIINTGEGVIDKMSIPMIDGIKMFQATHSKDFVDLNDETIIFEGTWNNGRFTGEASTPEDYRNLTVSVKFDDGKMTGTLGFLDSPNWSPRNEFSKRVLTYKWRDGICNVSKIIKWVNGEDTKEEYTLKDGKLHGLCMRKDKDNRREESEYKEGKLNGYHKVYNRAGWLETETQYQNDVKHGNEILYNSDKTIASKKIFRNGTDVTDKIERLKRLAKENVSNEKGIIKPKRSKLNKTIAVLKDMLKGNSGK